MRLLHLSMIVVTLLCACDKPGDVPPTPRTAESSPSLVSEARAAAPASSKMAPALGTVTRDTELKAKPAIDATTVKRLARGSAVTIIDRDGGWLKITSGAQQGWVRLLHVNSQPPGSRSTGAKELESAAKIATGRAGSGNVVATTGIRGLNEEQLRSASPNPAEVKKLEDYAASKEQAVAYAQRHKLAGRSVAHVAAPK